MKAAYSTKELLHNDSEKQISKLAELGYQTPVILIKAIQAELHEKASKWLEDNGAPFEVIRAFEISDMMWLLIEYINTGKLSEFDAEVLSQDLIEASNLALKFGGTFLNGWIVGDPEIKTGFSGKPEK